MNFPQSPLVSSQEFPLPDEFANMKDLETFLLESANPYLSIAYATEFADLYFKLRKERQWVAQLQPWAENIKASPNVDL